MNNKTRQPFDQKKLSYMQDVIKASVSKIHKSTSLKVLWELYQLTSSSGAHRSRVIYNLPKEGVGAKPSSKYFVPPWQIEQAANVIAAFGSEYSKNGYIDFRDWNRISELFRSLYEFNEELSKATLENRDVFVVLGQIGSQQLIWQDGSLGMDTLCRFSYIYGGEECNQICIEKYGVPVTDFLSYGFILTAQFHSNPMIEIPYDLSLIGGSNNQLKKVLNRFSISLTDLRSKTRSMRRDQVLGEYSKSIFRQFPIIRENQFHYFCVNPSFLILRITSGLISEVSGEKGSVRNEIGRRFEEYFQSLLISSFPKTKILGEEVYGSRKAIKNTPDHRLYDDLGNLMLIFECKSTRLNFDSKFNPEKLENLPDRSDEIVKAFTQIWQYADLSNQQKTPDTLAKKAMGLIVTLEPWIQLNAGRYKKLITLAHAKADEMKLSDECRIKVVLASIGELEYILPRSSVDDLASLLDEAKEPEFNGYMLYNVFTSKKPNAPIVNEFDRDEILADTIWYWNEVKEKRLSI